MKWFKGDLTADLTFRLGKFVGKGPAFWVNLQNAYGLDWALSLPGDKLVKYSWESVVCKAG